MDDIASQKQPAKMTGPESRWKFSNDLTAVNLGKATKRCFSTGTVTASGLVGKQRHGGASSDMSALLTIAKLKMITALQCIYTAILPAPISLNHKGTTH